MKKYMVATVALLLVGLWASEALADTKTVTLQDGRKVSIGTNQQGQIVTLTIITKNMQVKEVLGDFGTHLKNLGINIGIGKGGEISVVSVGAPGSGGITTAQESGASDAKKTISGGGSTVSSDGNTTTPGGVLNTLGGLGGATGSTAETGDTFTPVSGKQGS